MSQVSPWDFSWRKISPRYKRRRYFSCNTDRIVDLRSRRFCFIVRSLCQHFFLNTNTSSMCISTRWGVFDFCRFLVSSSTLVQLHVPALRF